MKPNISEFSYGYALTSELLNHFMLQTGEAPFFPSLLKEGKLGYDVKIPHRGLPIFLQFKLSDYMFYSSAKGSDLVAVPHYRMYLRPLKHSQLHNLLLALENTGNDVYYATPEFHQPHELNDAYAYTRVVKRSAFFRPKAIGRLPDNGQHFLIFGAGAKYGYRLSEPQRVSKEHGPTLFAEQIAARVRSDDARLLDTQYFRQLGDEMRELWEPSAQTMAPPERNVFVNTLESVRAQRGPLEYVSYVSRTLFDCQFLIALQE